MNSSEVLTATGNNSTALSFNAKLDLFLFLPLSSVITLFGLCGNVLCVIIFSRVSAGQDGIRLLKYLTISDIIALIFYYAHIVIASLMHVTQTPEILLRIKRVILPFTWVVYSFEIYLTILIALQRAFALLRPLLLDKYFGRKVTNSLVIVNAGLSILLGIPTMIANWEDIHSNMNETSRQDFKSTTGYSVIYVKYFSFIYRCLLPITILFICNISFVLERRKMAVVLGRIRDRNSRTMTAIVVGITTMALVTHIISSARKLFPQIPFIIPTATTAIIIKLSTNFVFYSLFGRRFRKTLNVVFRRGGPIDENSTGVTQSSTA